MSNSFVEQFTVGWICAVQEEYDCACRMLDEEYDIPDTFEIADNNNYVFGGINGHGIVIGCLPGGAYGTNNAAILARDMVRTFPNLKFALMVGIGGGAPTSKNDVRLGDVVVSEPRGILGGVIQFDLGKRSQDGSFQRTGQLNSPPQELLRALPEMRRLHNDRRKPDRIAQHIQLMDDMPEYQRPKNDQLYRSDYMHQGGQDCGSCHENGVVEHERLPRPGHREVTVHYGTIASSNTVMKDAVERDRYATDKNLNILCFEMEAAGLMNNLPSIVIRGICDYSDSHKNDEWHNYAALVAAAYAREYLYILRPIQLKKMPSWAAKIETMLGSIQKRVSNIGQLTEEISQRQRGQEDEEILKWLAPNDSTSQQRDFLSRRHPGTGEWFLNSTQYLDWLESNGSALLCEGFPGVGKTILTATVVDNITRKFEDDPDVGIVYIYCNYQRNSEQQATDLFAALLKGLSRTKKPLPECIKELAKNHKEKDTQPELEEIAHALRSVVSTFRRVFVLVDALDECQSANGVRSTLVEEIFKLKATQQVNIFATSRPMMIQDVIDKFQTSPIITIRASDEDIRHYLESQIQQLRRPFFNKVQNEVVSKITEVVDGVFLLAQLHFQTVSIQISLYDVKQTLQSLPTGSEAYYDAYEQAMERINNQNKNFRRLALDIISWVTFAIRPLTTIELQHALAVEIGTENFNEEKLPDVDDMLSACAGLVTIDHESDTIRLVHYTLQNYFEKTRQRWFPDAEDTITATNVTYISYEVFEQGECADHLALRSRFEEYPFYEYAALNWGYHARRTSTVSPEILKFLSDTPKMDCAAQAMGISKSSRLAFNLKMNALHFAAYFGLTEIVKILLANKRENPNQTNTIGQTPIFVAAQNGYHEVVKLLLMDARVDPDLGALSYNNKTNNHRTSLSIAAERGHRKVARMLLKDSRVEVNSRTYVEGKSELKDGRTPLSFAAAKGHGKMVKLLLSYSEAAVNIPSKPESWNVPTFTPLILAAMGGHNTVVKLLLEVSGIEPDWSSNSDHPWQGRGRTALSYAAENGHEDVVKLLLSHNKVKPDSVASGEGSRGKTPLSFAAKSGHESIVKLFLNYPSVDPNSHEFHETACGKFLFAPGSPLRLAAKNGHTEIVRLLLADKRVDTRLAMTYMKTNALMQAAYEGKETVVKILLEDGRIDINAQDHDGQTALFCAVRNGHEGVVKLFLARKEINTTIRDKEGRTAYAFAEAIESRNIANIILLHNTSRFEA